MIEPTVTWHEYPKDPPEKIAGGQYKRYMVAIEDGHVFECSWLGGGWHKRHDGCSDYTKQVEWWCERPEAPKLCPVCAEGNLTEKTQSRILEWNGAEAKIDGFLYSTCDVCESEVVDPPQSRINKNLVVSFRKQNEGDNNGQ